MTTIADRMEPEVLIAGERDNFAHNFGQRFLAPYTETIDSAEIPDVEGLTISGKTIDGYKVVCTIVSNTPGDYVVPCTITTSAGRILTINGPLIVTDQ